MPWVDALSRSQQGRPTRAKRAAVTRARRGELSHSGPTRMLTAPGSRLLLRSGPWPTTLCLPQGGTSTEGALQSTSSPRSLKAAARKVTLLPQHRERSRSLTVPQSRAVGTPLMLDPHPPTDRLDVVHCGPESYGTAFHTRNKSVSSWEKDLTGTWGPQANGSLVPLVFPD